MKILLTGASGYIGKRLLPELLTRGHEVVALVRDENRFSFPKGSEAVLTILQADLLDNESLEKIPTDIDVAFYLVHSMAGKQDFQAIEEKTAKNFKHALEKTQVRQVIYLSGLANEPELSKHLSSRKNVEETLKSNKYSLTTLRAGIIIGSGSASFEIIRDLVEKLPVMIAPKWLNTRCQPIAIANVLDYLTHIIDRPETFNKTYDIGGPDILTYREMLLQFAEVRKLKRWIGVVPVLTPRLSSYWLYFVTRTSYRLASALVDSMKVEVICKNNDIQKIVPLDLYPYKTSIAKAFNKINNQEVLSSWKDAFSSGNLNFHVSDFIEVPMYGCFKDQQVERIVNESYTINKIWNIGGVNGWYYANWLWKIRGLLDKMIGGVGLRRGRTNTSQINTGDAIDFWRVLYADKEKKRLLLFAEMKLPGEAWLDFQIKEDQLIQTATFRPIGLLGRLYWYSVVPFHLFIFKGLIRNLIHPKS